VRLVPFAAALVLALLPLPSLARPGAVGPSVAGRVAEQGRAVVVVEIAEAVLPEGWLADPSHVRAQRRRVVGAQIDAIYDLAGTDAGPVRPYPVIPFMTLEVGPRALAALEASPFVRSVAVAETYAPTLTETVPIIQGPEAHAIGFDGAGQTVVVLDTGTDLDHVNFAGKGVDEACFADGANNAGLPQNGGGDCPGGGDTAFGAGAAVPCGYHAGCFHGTHVAGIAVGEGPDFDGVAIGAGVIPIQIFSQFPANDPKCGGTSCPLAWSFDQDAALLYVYDTLRWAHDVASVNLSLGSGAHTSSCDTGSQASTKAAIDQLRSVGIATVAAAGNNSCGGTGCTDAISAPACISSAISVSATANNLSIRSWANYSSFTSLFAPGNEVGAPKYFTPESYMNASGTSMAAPHVAGAFAILRQALPTASVTSLLTALQETGQHVTLGVNRLQIRDALGALGFPECADGIDNDGDGLSDDDDPGCESSGDPFEKIDTLPCDDGDDNDFDGAIDMDDPGCHEPSWPTESPACSDGVDNDEDGGIDFAGSPPDSHCSSASQNSEASASQLSCGLGPGLALLLPCLWAARRRLR
jgi:subtilisin